LGMVNDHSLYMDAMLRIIRYCALGVWLTAGAPWLFTKLNLAERDNKDRRSESQ